MTLALLVSTAAAGAPRQPSARPSQPPASRTPAEPVGVGSPAPLRLDESAPATSPHVDDDVRLLPSGGSAIHFVVEVPGPDLIAVSQDGQAGAGFEVNLPGYEPVARSGAAQLPQRIVVVAVPPVGEVRLRSQGANATFRDGVALVRLPGKSRSVSLGAPARLLDVSWMRNQRIARVAIEPISYDPATARLASYGQVDVTLEVAPVADLGTAGEPRDSFEGIYHDLLLNYEQGRSWRRSSVPVGRQARPGAAWQALQRFAVAVSPDTSVYAGRLWVKLQVTQAGFYKVSFAQLRNTGLFTQTGTPLDTMTSLDSLRLYTWPGVPVLPENSFCDSCDYREVAIQFVDSNNDGLFGSNKDYFYFFALGPNDWKDVYDPTRTDTTFLDHPYETRNFYYLTIGAPGLPVGGPPNRITPADASVTGGPATLPLTFDARAHFEQDNEYFPDATPLRAGQNMFWEKWLWRSLSIGQSYLTTLNLDGIDISKPARLRLRAFGINNCTPCFLPTPPADHLLDVTVNGSLGNPELAQLAWFDDTGATLDTILAPASLEFQPGANTLQLGVPTVPACATRQDRSGLAWVDIFYQHIFLASNEQLAFDSPAVADNYRFVINGFQSSTPPRVFDVTDPASPLELTGFEYTNPGAGWRLRFERSQISRRRYRVLPDTAIVLLANTNVADAPIASLQNLRSSTRGADYIVIYFDAFAAAAESLATWRQSHLPLDAGPGPYRSFLVPVSAIYDQFSGGRTDPAAMRNFLRAAFQHWAAPAPTFVTLLGDASFDFKNITGHATAGYPSCLLPAYENAYDAGSFLPGDPCSPFGRQFSEDDWILNVDSAGAVVPDFLGGRIPVDDPATALDYVRSKLLFYERSAPLGEYRNHVMLVADDAQQGERDDGLHWVHVRQSRDLDVASTPNHIDRDYVYLHKYPTAPGFTKPGAKADIRKLIGEGTTIWNYVGHGSPFKISDEGVFLDVDSGTLTNATMMPVFISASCDVGKFNDPSVASLGERLITQHGGGTIGVISATELALSNQNATLNRTIFEEIFKRDTLIAGGRYYRSLAGALLTGKLRGTSTTQKYQVLGDGAIRLNLPREWVDVTLWDSAGTTADTLMRGGTVKTFKGIVRDRPGSTVVLPFNGVASLEIDDSQPLELTPDCALSPGCPGSGRVLYYYTPGVIFRGEVGITNGLLQGRFVVPLDAAVGAHARVRAYITGRPTGLGWDEDGVGSIRTSAATGTAPPGDVSGPRITLSFIGGATVVKPDATLNVDLFDPSGILTTGHNAQNGIVLTLDGNTTQRVDITPSFRYAANSYQSGIASYKLPGIALGGHTVEVSAADNLASGLSAGVHRSKAALDFVVQETPELSIVRAYLFPDPTRSGGPGSGGRFVVDAPGDSLNALLRLYTVTGRLIRTLRSYAGLGQVQIPWDGLDEEGQNLANGVYLFRVHVYGRQDDGSSSSTERANSNGRFVIVNR